MEENNVTSLADEQSTIPFVKTEITTEKAAKEDAGKSYKKNTSDTSDMYRYIKDDLFTSEIYKVEIQNLPKYIGFNEVKKFLAKYGLNPHKIKLLGKQTFAFVTFKSEEERDKAMKVLHGVLWKNRNLSVKLAKPKADPIMKKRRREEEEEGGEVKEQTAAKCPSLAKDGREEPISKQIADVVTPSWNVPYEEQLAKKQQECEQVLLKLTREIGNNNKALLPWLFVQKEKSNGLCCCLEGVKASPSQTEYRNKCEFLIGIGPNQEDKSVGFRLGKYKGGTCAVVEPFETVHIPAVAKKVVKAFRDYIRSTPYNVYSPETYDGHWKQLTVRTSRNGHIMAIAYFNPQKLDKDELIELQSSLAKYFTEGMGKDSGITSLYFVEEGQRKSPNREDLPLEHIAGNKYIYEDLLGLKFRISPHAFFQINTQAAEVLYSTIHDWAQVSQDTTVLDVCCGTGSIGISLAKKVKKVIGIELCQEAVEDARANAELNELNNVELHSGKAEDLVPYLQIAIDLVVTRHGVFQARDQQRWFAIACLYSKVILAIRKAEHLKKLIYVSCNPRAAMNNFVDLCRAPSNRVKGSPFRPVRAVAVDLFPQTMHCELLLYFERIEHSSEKPPEALVDSAEIPAMKPEAGASMEEDNTDLPGKHTAEESSS
ncbi:PREDICTED: tRNA (uracil-5-)-methyltransferase homolog A [Gekko japonicus]|uniref:tRNA (uracil(54)-C(5))-methyltransferase n=1 Tax=Gekko japonicus TaxID=146911 RepID=A0ABM1KZY9_GEKJA|nr:PREDICTED: tRNA (uracil-5-)-methyltransferase homolog A [Gekko japonicus]